MNIGDNGRRFDGVARNLIRGAAARAPAPLRERLEEEWLANCEQLRGAWARLRFALGCRWAAPVIVRDARLAVLPVMSGAPAATLRSFVDDHVPRLSKRGAAFLAVVALHIGVMFAFINGLRAPAVLQSHRGPMENHPVAPSPPRRLALDVPPPRADQHKLVVDMPEVPHIDPVGDEDTTVQSTGSDAVGFEGGTVGTPFDPPPRPAVDRKVGGPGAGFPHTEDYYPSLAIHMGEQGSAAVNTCVDPNGRLTAEPTLVTSSGSTRLDEAALRLAKAGSGHYKATLEDGRAVQSCYSFRVVFALRN